MATKRTKDETTDAAAAEPTAEPAAPPLVLPIIHGHVPPPGFIERDGAFVPFKTAEQWAEAKGMFPELVEVAAPFARADAPKTRQYNPSFWRFAATRAGSGWPIGKELTEAEFDAAVEAATTQTYR